MGKPLSERMKAKISDLYNNSNISIGSIADKLDVSVDSVKRHKNYGYQESDIQPESYDQDEDEHQEIEEDDQYQDTDLEDEIEDDEQETETIEDYEPSEARSWEREEVTECPQCGTPKSECFTIEEALEQGYKISELHQHFYDYLCSNPECRTLFPEKRLKASGTCPGQGCGSTSRDWAPIEEGLKFGMKIPEGYEENFNFFCLDCGELFRIVD